MEQLLLFFWLHFKYLFLERFEKLDLFLATNHDMNTAGFSRQESSHKSLNHSLVQIAGFCQ